MKKKGTPKKPRINVKLSDEDYAKLKTLASSEEIDRSITNYVSFLVRQLIHAEWAKRNNPPLG